MNDSTLRITFAKRAPSAALRTRRPNQRSHSPDRRSRRATHDTRPLTPGEVAWLLSVPCAVLTAAAMMWLGVPLGNLLLSAHGRDVLLPEYDPAVLLKPAERARYLIALAAPAALAMATLGLAWRSPRLPPRTIGALVQASQGAGAAFIAVCIWIQSTVAFSEIVGVSAKIEPYFTVRTLFTAAALAAVVVFAIRYDPLRRRVTRVLSSRSSAIAGIGLAVAVLTTAIWLLGAVNFDSTIANSNAAYNLKANLDETFAVLDGRTTLVNFTATYGSLWPYPTALIMSLLGTTLGVYSVTMCAITGLGMLAVFATLRRVTHNALAALLLYLPFLATSFFETEPGLVNRSGPLISIALFPLRYAGPYMLVWLVARHLDGARPSRRWMLFLAAGLVALNNVDFGSAALGATLAALLWTGTPLRWRGVARLLCDALAGLLAAYALVSVLTLARTGSLPQISVLLFYPRLFAVTGFGLLPTRTLGFEVVVYLTYVAAIGTATVRAIHGDSPRLLTGLLAWSGVFGLGVGSYYMGRSSDTQLITMFSAWTFALALLTLAVVEQIARDPERRLTPAHIATFLGMGLAACSLAQTPTPWTQIERLRTTAAPQFATSTALKQILRHYSDGRPAAIMSVLGHRQAYESGIVNVSPYLGSFVIVSRVQLDNTLHALHAAGGRLLALPLATTYPSFYRIVCAAGFSYLNRMEVNFEFEGSKRRGLTLWTAPVPGVAPRPCPIG